MTQMNLHYAAPRSLIKGAEAVAVLSALTLSFASNACASARSDGDAATSSRNRSVAIVAHRGFWDCDEGGRTHNSLAALKAAQAEKFWGAEFDVHLTSDGVAVVNHDDVVGGVRIDASPYSALNEVRLRNGEKVPTLDEYLAQGRRSRRTVLVLEVKPHPTPEQEVACVGKCIEALKAHRLLKPRRVVFISFSLNACQAVVRLAPGFDVQYLGSDLAPRQVHGYGISGMDTNFSKALSDGSWIPEAKSLGMDVNLWTVNAPEDIRRCIEAGADVITTNAPLLVRSILSDMGIRERRR